MSCLLQECTCLWSVTRRDVIWGQKGLVCCKNARFMRLIIYCLLHECTFLWSMTCLVQEGTLYGVKKDLSVTRMHVT